jgi:hypothetical protein
LTVLLNGSRLSSIADYQWKMTMPNYPLSSQKQLWTLLEALRRGERLTVANTLDQYGVYALSQRMGELKKLGWPIESKMIEVFSGKRVAAYWLTKADAQVKNGTSGFATHEPQTVSNPLPARSAPIDYAHRRG